MPIKQARTTNIDEMLPLLQSIQREINERMACIASLDQRLRAFSSTRHLHGRESARIESELSTQRRELRQISRELARLGVAFDAEHPHPIVTPARAAPELESSGFHPWTTGSPA